jgi:hypothetical protein
MTRPKVRIGTPMLLVVIAALVVAVVVQGRKLAESRRRITVMQANDDQFMKWMREAEAEVYRDAMKARP